MNKNKFDTTLNILCPMHAATGSVRSALTLCELLGSRLELKAWSLPLHKDDDTVVEQRFRERGVSAGTIDETVHWPDGANFYFHMGEYPIVFGQHEKYWRPIFERAASVQFSINFGIGRLPEYPWLAEVLSVIYFQNSDMAGLWQRNTEATPLERVPVMILPPPVDIEPFLCLPVKEALQTRESVIIGLLSGSVRLAPGVIDFYRSLAVKLPAAEFWFMPTPEIIRKEFSGHPRFRLFNKDEISVHEFMQAMDIYCLPSSPNAHTLQGTRTLVEAMAAGKACVFVDRLGPRDRIEHGESGYKTNRLDEMAKYVIELANDTELRNSIEAAARRTARGWPLTDWRDAILSYVV